MTSADDVANFCHRPSRLCFWCCHGESDSSRSWLLALTISCHFRLYWVISSLPHCWSAGVYQPHSSPVATAQREWHFFGQVVKMGRIFYYDSVLNGSAEKQPHPVVPICFTLIKTLSSIMLYWRSLATTICDDKLIRKLFWKHQNKLEEVIVLT